jgi:hypothetical protein
MAYAALVKVGAEPFATFLPKAKSAHFRRKTSANSGNNARHFAHSTNFRQYQDQIRDSGAGNRMEIRRIMKR